MAQDVRIRGPRTRYLLATLIDAVGSGLWMPFALLFLVNAQHLSLASSGRALSTGALLGLAAGPVAGTLMDRLGPVRLLVVCNLIRLGAFATYPLVTNSWQVIAVACVISVGDRVFWTVNSPIVHALAEPRGDAERLLGAQTIGRFAGAGLGAGVTALIPNPTNPATYHLLAYLNAASFGIAAALVFRLPLKGTLPQDRVEPGSGWATVLRDRAYVGLCATNVLFTLASASKYTMLPVLALNILHTPHWVPGVAVGTGTVALMVVQLPITRVAARHRRTSGLCIAAMIFAATFATFICLTAVPVDVAIAVLIAGSVVLAVAEALFAPLSTAAAAAAAPMGAQGRASALYQLSWAVSTMIAPALLTGLLTAGNAWLWITLAITSGAAAPIARWLQPRLPAASLGRPVPVNEG